MKELEKVFKLMESCRGDAAQLAAYIPYIQSQFDSGAMSAQRVGQAQARYPRALALALSKDPSYAQALIGGDSEYPVLSFHLSCIKISRLLQGEPAEKQCGLLMLEGALSGLVKSSPGNLGTTAGYSAGFCIGLAMRSGLDARAALRRVRQNGWIIKDEDLFCKGIAQGYCNGDGSDLSEQKTFAGSFAERYEEWDGASRVASVGFLRAAQPCAPAPFLAGREALEMLASLGSSDAWAIKEHARLSQALAAAEAQKNAEEQKKQEHPQGQAGAAGQTAGNLPEMNALAVKMAALVKENGQTWLKALESAGGAAGLEEFGRLLAAAAKFEGHLEALGEQKEQLGFGEPAGVRRASKF